MPSRNQGFTLIELMVTVAIVAILASVALPAYNSYVQRSRVPPALDALSSVATRLEQRYQDTGNYAGGGGGCGVAMPTVENFAIGCALSNVDQGFTLSATGSGPMSGYLFTLNHQGTRTTTSHPKGLPGANCWSIRGKTCDA